MAVVEKTFETPYITHAVGGTETIVTGIIDYIKVTSDDPADDCEVLTKRYGDETFTSLKVSAGDSLYGPFVAAKTSTTATNTPGVLFYERSKITTV